MINEDTERLWRISEDLIVFIMAQFEGLVDYRWISQKPSRGRNDSSSAESVVEKTFSSPPPPAYNGESPWRSLPVVEPEQRRRRRKRGSRAGVLVRLRKRKRENRPPPLPSILLANVQSLDNKLDELRSRMAFQRDIKNCNVLVFTETWLDPSIPDSAIVPEGLSIHRQDRTINSGKSKGGGVCFMVNNKWCSDVEVISTGDSTGTKWSLITRAPTPGACGLD
ncbi:hypothetical protein L3Q82_007089 [Scortum barcoo]|uniref:Uncharacterized protein n=1 Tax=Scortum barcoo TaxID=214431 RepID=A0ACB8WRM7_9TELE|nr:hypothetical protein L3Q82_007089 [Scortum barcoo]